MNLGGKSPVLVDKSANLKLAARQIVWGKTLNSGQTCIAPDYLLVHSDVKNRLIDHIISEINVQWGENVIENDDYPIIISLKHFGRLKAYLKDKNNKVLHGGKYDEKKLKIGLSLVACSESSELLKEEIFGPILPIVTFSDVDFAINYIKDREKPLAFYLFSSDKKFQERAIDEVSFGGGCVNDTIMHLANHILPFGGVGGSGFGSYHGEYSFDAFSHKKSVAIKNNSLDLPLRYSPFTEKKLKLIKKLLG